MFSNEKLDENFQTLVFEVRKQVEDTFKALESPSPDLVEKIAAEGDYVDNLKNVIRLKIYSRLAQAEKDDRLMINQVMAIETITTNLERIGDFCENIVCQLQYLSGREYFNAYGYHRYFDQILTALDLIEKKIIDKGNIHDALSVCKAESELDAYFASDLRSLLNDLNQAGSQSGNIITTIFILRYLERIGDALLNIGEAFLSSITGRKLKIEQYLSLVETLHNGHDFSIEKIGSETRSGCRIEKVKPGSSTRNAVIFKEGKKKKLYEEKEQLEQWQALFPGLTPKVYGFEERGENATLLLEFISGFTLQEIMLTGDLQATRHAMETITGILDQIWSNTLLLQPVAAGYINQIERRMHDVYRLHPEFNRPRWRINDLEVMSSQEIVTQMKDIETRFPAPFSVLIHGDLNNDNILFDPQSKRVSFIDIHRSIRSDYIQDLAVLMVSNFRMPVTERRCRCALDLANILLYEFGRSFSIAHQDSFFQERLALGLLRSFFTSTRFSIRKKNASEMFLRANYLMEKLMRYTQGELDSEFTVGTEMITVY